MPFEAPVTSEVFKISPLPHPLFNTRLSVFENAQNNEYISMGIEMVTDNGYGGTNREVSFEVDVEVTLQVYEEDDEGYILKFER